MPPDATKSGPAIIAGACGYGRWPTNSLEGAARCLTAGVDGIEIDVHLSADGHVVLHHDYCLDPAQTRLDGAWIDSSGAPLRDRTLDGLRRYDLGQTRRGTPAFERHPDRIHMDGVRIATLPELLDLLRAAPCRARLFVEIKTSPQSPADSSDPTALTGAVIRDIAAADYMEDTRIIAFDWRVLREVRRIEPRLATAHLAIPEATRGQIVRDANGDSPWADGCDPRHFGGNVLHAIKAHGGSCWSPYFKDVHAEQTAEAAMLGLSIAIWGVDAVYEAMQASVWGCESITVSDPAIRPPARLARIGGEFVRD